MVQITREQSFSIFKIIALFGAFLYLMLLAGVFMLILYNGEWTIHRDLLTSTDMSFVLFSSMGCLALLLVEVKKLNKK